MLGEAMALDHPGGVRFLANFVGWIKRSGSTVANVVRLSYKFLVGPLRLIHPTILVIARNEVTKQSRS